MYNLFASCFLWRSWGGVERGTLLLHCCYHERCMYEIVMYQRYRRLAGKRFLGIPATSLNWNMKVCTTTVCTFPSSKNKAV